MHANATRHVLLAIDSLTGRGAEKVVVNLAEALLRLGHRVGIVIYEDVVEFDVNPRILIHRLNPVARGKMRLFSRLTDHANVQLFKALLKDIEGRQGRVDIILSALPRMDRILSCIQDKRIHHVIHNALSLQNGIRKNGWRKRLARIWHAKRMYDGRQIVVVSGDVGEDLKTFVKVRPATLRTIYNPFDVDRMLALACEPFDPPAQDYILHVGAFTLKQKRQDVLIEAFAASGLQCSLVLLGKGRDEAKIREIAKRCGVEGRVIFAGFQANPYPWIRAARLLVLSSDYEGFGNVLVEAMIVGTPVLSTDCPAGPGEILASMPECLVPAGDVQALAARMKALHHQPPPIDSESLRRFEATTIADEYLGLMPPLKILIVKRDKLGDMLLTTPMLAWLRQALPHAQLHVLANDYNSWVLDGNPHVDKVWVLPRVRHAGKLRIGAALLTMRMLWQLRREKFDWALVGNGEESPRAIERGLSVRARNTVSYCMHPAKWPKLTHPLPVPDEMHESRRLANLAAPIGLQVPDPLPAPIYVLPRSGVDFAEKWLTEHGLTPRGYVVLGLGARRAKKQPSTSQVLEWSAEVAKRWGLKTVFMWTPGKSDNELYPGDDEVAEPVLAANSPNIVPFRGPLKEAIALVWHARTSLFPDSGLMHFAAASPGGVLGFFAESDVSPPPSKWAPLGPKARWLDAERAVAELDTEIVLGLVGELIER